MTKEQAIEILKIKYREQSYGNNFLEVLGLINEIYDAIGSCDKCKHSYIGGSFLRCNKQNGLIKENDDYCSDFEERI